jgi:hypothetical protein
MPDFDGAFSTRSSKTASPPTPMAADTFRTEQEAKAFARAKLAESLNINAGTINPHLPKRTISSAQLLDWLDEPDS